MIETMEEICRLKNTTLQGTYLALERTTSTIFFGISIKLLCLCSEFQRVSSGDLDISERIEQC